MQIMDPAAMKPKTHLKFAGLTPSTLRAYKRAVHAFLIFAKKTDVATIRPSKLDSLVADYLNECFQEGEPISYCGHLLSAIKRFHPSLRSHLPVSSQYYKNWCKVYKPQRATPASWELVEAMIGFCVSNHQLPLAFLLGVGFDAMLRTSELLSLTHQHVLLSPHLTQASLVIPSSKTSQGNPQVLRISDKFLLKLAAAVVKPRSKLKPLWVGSASDFRKQFDLVLQRLGFPSKSYVPYALRRGGATYHFLRWGSLDSTVLKGRWACSRTARQYLDDGTAQLAHISWTSSQLRKVKKFREKGLKWRLRQS